VPDWVLAAERAYIAWAVRPEPAPRDAGSHAESSTPRTEAPDDHARSEDQADDRADDRPPDRAPGDLHARAIAAASAIASRHLAIGSPRSFGIVIDAAAQVDAATLSLTAHRTWFAPRDIRCAATGSGAAELAAATGGRVVSIDEALACDIVHLDSCAVRILPAQLRRGSHVNAVSTDVFAPELLTRATVVHETRLPALAAGLMDGRQLDELTIFAIDGAPIAVTALLRPA
jgi:hypothetical protein